MSKKIIIVDDDPEVRLVNTTVVEELGHAPMIATNGEEGLAMVEKDQPDLIILDVLMPRQSGIKMYRRLKTNPKWRKIPVIILSGISRRTFLRSQEALTEFEGDQVPEPEAYFEKPITPEELASAIQKILS